MVAGAFAASQTFFAQDRAAKNEFAIARTGSNRSCVGLGVEALDEAAAPDPKEAFNLIWTDERSRPPNVWPALPQWRERALASFDAVLAVGRTLHVGFALAGAFICNIGECLMRWTNDVCVSTPRRVLQPPRARYSIAFFLDPNPDTLVSAIPQCVPAGEAPRYLAITAAEHLAERFAAPPTGARPRVSTGPRLRARPLITHILVSTVRKPCRHSCAPSLRNRHAAPSTAAC